MASTLPTHMRAAQWTTVPIESSLKVNERAPLPPSATRLPKNAALIKVAYASLNPVDYKFGEFSLARTLLLGPAPYTPAADYAGTVVSTTMDHVKPGDRVAGCLELPAFGTLAEYVVVTGGPGNVCPVPDNVSLRDASTLAIGAMTALQCLAPSAREGAKVIINGASGGLGTFGVQIAKTMGFEVTAICSGANAELCLKLGADRVVDYKKSDIVKELGDKGPQYDLFVDNVDVGGPVVAQAHKYLQEDGRYATVAFAPSVSSFAKIFKLMLQPAWLGGVQRKCAIVGRQASLPDFAKLTSMIGEGKLTPHIEKVYSLEESADAYAMLKTGRTRGKLVIKVAAE